MLGILAHANLYFDIPTRYTRGCTLLCFSLCTPAGAYCSILSRYIIILYIIAGNILLDDSHENAYIGDFGNAKECSADDLQFKNGKWSDYWDLIKLVYQNDSTEVDYSKVLDSKLKALVEHLKLRAGP